MTLRKTIFVWISSIGIVLPMAARQAAPPVAAQPSSGVENARLADVTTLDGKIYHLQGVELDRDHIWITSIDTPGRKAYLHQFNRATGKFEREVDLTDGPRIHPGGFSIYKDSIWIPVADNKPHSTAVLVELDKNTLTVKRKIPVPDHLGCLAVTGENLVAGNWDSEQLYIFDMQGRQLRVIDNPLKTRYQDMKFADGYLVGSGLTTPVGSIDWYAWPSMKPVRRIQAGRTDEGDPFTDEGMALHGTDLYLLPEGRNRRLYHFVLNH